MPVSNSVKFEKIEKKEFEPIPANIYQVQIGDITEKLKTPWGSPQGTEPTEQYLTFEFIILNEGAYKGRKLWKDVRPVSPTPSEGGSYKPSWMWRIVSAVYKHPFTFQEGASFGPEAVNSMIGQQLRLIVNQTPKNAQGKSYNNITEVLPVEGEMPPLLADNEQSEGVKPTLRETVAKHAPSIVRDDPTDGEINPMVNDEPPIDVEGIPF
jgi:hypothetical protein